MLLNFRVANYRSFKDEVSLSFLSTRLDADVGFPAVVSVDKKTVDVLPVIAVLGANASGKSNLLRAVEWMRDVVLNSASRPRYETMERDPFVLDRACLDEPTLLEIEFAIAGDRFQYGFEINDGDVIGEWLHTYPHKRAQTLFDRDRKDYTFGKKLGGQTKFLSEITRDDVLFLSAGAQAGHEILTRIYEWFLTDLSFLDVPSRAHSSRTLAGRIERRRNQAVQLLAEADLGVVDARVDRSREVDFPDPDAFREAFWDSFPADMSDADKEREIVQMYEIYSAREEVKLLHRGARGAFAMPFEEESLGTKSWMAFVAYALDALDSGGVLFVDELDASLHPLLMARAIALFQDRRTNRHGAQLLFTTHDTTILSGTGNTMKLSRGQIWLADKSDVGASTLLPLTDFRPRKNEDLERGYLQGRYGGTPRIQRGQVSRATSEIAGRDG